MWVARLVVIACLSGTFAWSLGCSEGIQQLSPEEAPPGGDPDTVDLTTTPPPVVPLPEGPPASEELESEQTNNEEPETEGEEEVAGADIGFVDEIPTDGARVLSVDVSGPGASAFFDFVLLESETGNVPLVAYQQGSSLRLSQREGDHHWVRQEKLVPGSFVKQTYHPRLVQGSGGRLFLLYRRGDRLEMIQQTPGGSRLTLDPSWLEVTDAQWKDAIGSHHDILVAYWNRQRELSLAIFPGGRASARPPLDLAAGPGKEVFFAQNEVAIHVLYQGNRRMKIKTLRKLELAEDAEWRQVSDAPIIRGAVAFSPCDAFFCVVYEGNEEKLFFVEFNKTGDVLDDEVVAKGFAPSLAVREDCAVVTFFRDGTLWLAKRTPSSKWPWTAFAVRRFTDVSSTVPSIVRLDAEGDAHIVYRHPVSHTLQYEYRTIR